MTQASVLSIALFFVTSIPVLTASEPVSRVWMVEGTKREAVIFVPEAARTSQSPVVFCFHGHGGGSRQAAKSFRMHLEWPEAITVYMQGLPTPGKLTDPEGKKSGWQKNVGDQNDRDLKFFDAVIESVKKDYKVDESRIYAMGHSNGGGFTYLLWSARGDIFSAIAPSGSLLKEGRENFKPKPVMHIAGKNDPLVRFRWQEAHLEHVRKVNQCDEGQPWTGKATIYPSKAHAPVVTYFTDEGHKFPATAPALIVKFFKEHTKEVPAR